MKNKIKFVIFIIYTILIFGVNDIKLIGSIFLVNFIIAIILKIDLKRMLYNLKILLPFIIFTMLINIIFDSLYNGIIIGIRLIICYNSTYIFSKTLTIMEIAETIQTHRDWKAYC